MTSHGGTAQRRFTPFMTEHEQRAKNDAEHARREIWRIVARYKSACERECEPYVRIISFYEKIRTETSGQEFAAMHQIQPGLVPYPGDTSPDPFKKNVHIR